MGDLLSLFWSLAWQTFPILSIAGDGLTQATAPSLSINALRARMARIFRDGSRDLFCELPFLTSLSCTTGTDIAGSS